MGFVYRRKLRSGKQKWAVCYVDADGRTRRELIKSTTKTLAKRILSDRENAVERAKLQGLRSVKQLDKPKSGVTFRKFALEYMEHAKANKPKKSWERDENSLRHLGTFFGRMSLWEINPGYVQKYIDRRLTQKGPRKKPVKPRTIHIELSVLSAIFREAIKRELVDRNPVSFVKKPKIDNEIIRYLKPDEEKRLLANVPARFRPVIVTAIYTGLRDSELRSIVWSDVDLENCTVIVRKTKSKKDRVVALCEKVCETLEKLPRDIRDDHVFVNPETGKAYARSFNNTVWKKALRDAEITNLRFHDLRHTFASRLAQRGVSLIIIKELLGHSSITVTMRYAHLAPNNAIDAVRVLDEPVTTHTTTHGRKSG